MMIASLHPCIPKDINILCAGRALTDREKKRLQKARAVIVPQGVTAEVYRECRRLVPRVFPNYDLRFGLEGKVGDALLFEYFQVPHPRTLTFGDRESFYQAFPDPELPPALLSGYPLVLKGNEGGEGLWSFGLNRFGTLKTSWISCAVHRSGIMGLSCRSVSIMGDVICGWLFFMITVRLLADSAGPLAVPDQSKSGRHD